MKERHLRFAFSDVGVLNAYLSGRPLDFAHFKRQLFLAERRLDHHIPDHCHHLAQEHNFRGVESFRNLLTRSLPPLATSFLECDEDGLSIREHAFEDWQQLAIRISPLFLAVCAMFERHWKTDSSNDDFERRAWGAICGQFSKSSLLTVRHRDVGRLIESEGLADLHVHLNGSTEMDHVWLHALLQRRWFVDELDSGYRRKAAVVELYEQVEPGLTPQIVGERLRVARRLRIAMCEILLGTAPRLPTRTLVGLADIEGGPSLLRFDDDYHCEMHPIRRHRRRDESVSERQYEALFLLLALARLRVKPDEDFARALHCYLSIQSATFIPLCVQQREQVGFDQFQKITLNNIREPVEQEYCERFRQASYARGPSDLRLLEGRFAPKDSARRTAYLLHRIRAGHDRFLKASIPPADAGKDRLELRLVAHFIKDDELADRSRATFCRFYRLRHRLRRQARALVFLRERRPELAGLVTGVDGAANELHTPPEVFAPVFRFARRSGIPRATFHVGEDFHHLLSGIRAVWEAVHYLQLQARDRIGHGIAVGIEPHLWLASMPPRIALPQGEWLDSLVFASSVLTRIDPSNVALRWIGDEIHRLCDRIYGTLESSRDLPHDLEAAWLLRDRDPLLFFDPSLDSRCMLDKEDIAEREQIHAKMANQQVASDLYRRYHDPGVVERWRMTEEVDTRAITAETLRAIQDDTLHLLMNRDIAIETLVSSNVRISHYDRYGQHHITRWLPGEGKTAPRVCVGTDDPGIFVTNMRNEFLHIFFILREEGMPEKDALEALIRLNENARTYAFL